MSGHVYLVGFMGAGKSTVARILCDLLDRPCADLDAEIESRAGATVAEVFARQGEDAFRDLESEALEATSTWPPSVIACGGGVVVRPRNRAVLCEQGTVVYLRVTAGEALARVGDTASRPLLAGPSGELAAVALLKARETLYTSVADLTVDTVGRSADDVASEIASLLANRSGE